MPVTAKPLTLRIKVVVEPDEDGFHAYCPAFKGLHVDGSTPNEAFQNAWEAAMVYLDSLASNNEAIPIGPDCQHVDHVKASAVMMGGFVRDVELAWPSTKTFGTR